MYETAHAKLNLALHVRRREPDGYHVIETVFVFCEGGDRLELTGGEGIEVTGPFAAALAGGDNLVTRAAVCFTEIFGGRLPGFRLEKTLPVAAGIGGGSADAGAALRLLCRARDIAPDDRRVIGIAASLGADVPACLLSRAARGTGRGDQLDAIPDWQGGQPVLLVNPMVPLPTGAVFAAWDGVDRGPLEGPADGRNDLESPAIGLRPVIGDVLALLRARPGVTLARMSGSGATCFAMFTDDAARDAADAAIAAAAPHWWRMATRLL